MSLRDRQIVNTPSSRLPEKTWGFHHLINLMAKSYMLEKVITTLKMKLISNPVESKRHRSFHPKENKIKK
jgi:hypothetical protein